MATDVACGEAMVDDIQRKTGETWARSFRPSDLVEQIEVKKKEPKKSMSESWNQAKIPLLDGGDGKFFLLEETKSNQGGTAGIHTGIWKLREGTLTTGTDQDGQKPGPILEGGQSQTQPNNNWKLKEIPTRQNASLVRGHVGILVQAASIPANNSDVKTPKDPFADQQKQQQQQQHQ